jgi:crotonobetainyl-CoA:carnitine CoA-transferase CaiB-like acyl-CoA transferase
MPLLPLSLDGQRLPPRLPIAKVGEHTHDVLRGLGYSEPEIDVLSGAANGPQQTS